MLTSDLLRTRIRSGRVEPEYLDARDPDRLDRADTLIGIFDEHVGESRREVDDAVDGVVGYGTDYKIWRGLAKLLYDRSEFEIRAPAEPRELRRSVFERAASTEGDLGGDWRTRVLEDVAEEFDLRPEEIESGLYADLEDRRVLASFDALGPDQLLHRYNMALAQAVLYSATHLEIRVEDCDPNRLRYVFGALKFNRLMHRVRRVDGGYQLTVDGPASLFERTRKYGIHMARFLPALATAPGWELQADLDGEGESRRFEVSSEDGLVSHYDPDGQWKADEEAYFEEQFADWDTDWRLERRASLLDLGENEVLVADYALTGPDGRLAFLEIVGFWRISYLERRIELLERRDDLPLVLAVSDRLNTGRRELEESPAEVFFFKSVILVDEVLERARQVALPVEEAEAFCRTGR
ncbi:MAG: DUF790 family protein [Bradymonadaceae bacterium]